MLQFPVLVAKVTGQGQVVNVVRPALSFACEMFKGQLMHREGIPAIEALPLLLVIEPELLCTLPFGRLQLPTPAFVHLLHLFLIQAKNF
jgi:hypothetical protein